MKKIIFLMFLSFIPYFALAQIRVNAYYDGYWGEWEDGAAGGFLFGQPDGTLPYLKVYGNYSGFCIYISDTHPSTYTFKFQISNYYTPDKKMRKEHLKSNKWYEYYGVVEYYVDYELPTIKDIMRRGSAFGRIPVIQPGQQGARKRCVNATIQIAPYKDHPQVYNIWFEGIGVAIDLGTIYFPQ